MSSSMGLMRALATRVARESAKRSAATMQHATQQQRAMSALVVASDWPQGFRNTTQTTIAKRSFSKAAKKGKGGKPEKQPATNAAAPAAAANDSEGGDDDDLDAKVLLDKTKKNMTGAVLQFTRALSQMRPGKADAGIFDELNVQAYGSYVALSQVAQVAVVSSHALSVNVYDPSLLTDIKKAVEAMNPVFSVREDATALHVSFPKMSKETRAELIKAAKKQAEQSRQHVRRVRQDAMNSAKKFKETISEDDVKKHQDEIQKLTDDATAEIGKLLAAKEKDLVEV